MLIKKFNSFILCLGILIGSVCQSVSGTQKNLENKSDYIVVDENASGKRVFGKVGDLFTESKNKIKKLKDSIPREVYTAILTAFGAKIILSALKDGINQCCFSEENKTPEVNTRPEVKSPTPENSTPVTQKEENKSNFSKSRIDLQTEEKNKDQSNDPIVKPSSQVKDGSNSVESTKKMTEDTISGSSSKDLDPKTAGNVPNSSENLNTIQEEIPGENSSSGHEGLTTKTNEEELTISSNNDVNTRAGTAELEGDLMPILFGNYSDPIFYLLVSLTPEKWGLQKAWHNLWHFRTEDSKVVTVLKLTLLILSLANFSLNIYDFVTSWWEIPCIEKFPHKFSARKLSYVIGTVKSNADSLKGKAIYINNTLWLVYHLISLSPIADRLYGFYYIYRINKSKKKGSQNYTDLYYSFIVETYDKSAVSNFKSSLINIFFGKTALYAYVYHKAKEADYKNMQSKTKESYPFYHYTTIMNNFVF